MTHTSNRLVTRHIKDGKETASALHFCSSGSSDVDSTRFPIPKRFMAVTQTSHSEDFRKNLSNKKKHWAAPLDNSSHSWKRKPSNTLNRKQRSVCFRWRISKSVIRSLFILNTPNTSVGFTLRQHCRAIPFSDSRNIHEIIDHPLKHARNSSLPISAPTAA